MKKDIQEAIIQTVAAVKAGQPLVPSITNTVTINLVANTQLAVGGSAAMIYMTDEGVAMAEAGEAMYINLGTIFPVYEESIPATIQSLNNLKTPWVLDPVAVGMGKLRTKILQEMKEVMPTIIKGNATEIIGLAKQWDLTSDDQTLETKGVDSIHTTQEALSSAVALARHSQGAVVVSGPVDLVTNGQQLIYSHGGSSYMSSITGAGCALGGIITAYASKADPFIAAITGVNAFNYAGRLAEAKADGPASFQMHLIDFLYQADGGAISQVDFEVEEISHA